MSMKHFVDPAFMKHWIRIGSLLICLAGFGQDIAVGTWRTHYSYQNAQILASTETRLFCATENGLFSYSQDDHSIRKLSKLDGLSGAGISAMHYSAESDVLILGYYSGLIDLIYDDRIETLRELANSSLEGNKQINSIASENGRSYLGSDFGVIVINLSTGQIAENYINIGLGGSQASVKEIEILDNTLFAKTNEGVQSGNLDQNLLDFNNWIMFPSTDGFSNLSVVGNDIYTLSQSSLLLLADGNWIDSNFDLPQGTSMVKSLNEQLHIVAENNIYRLNENFFELQLTTSSNQIKDIEIFDNLIFIADATLGLSDESGTSLSPNGPNEDYFSRVRIIEDVLFAFHAPSPFTYNGTIQKPTFSIFSNGSWENTSITNFTNVSDVAVFNNNLYYSSIGDGLYDETNDTRIKSITNIQQDTVITGLASGRELWVASFGNQNPILFLNETNEWSYLRDDQVFDNEFLSIELSEIGIAWALASDGDITAINPNDVETELLSGTDGIPGDILDFVISVDDNVWLATPAGPAFFPSASNIFFDSQALRPTFDNRLLFEDQIINTVMTDGGNRIWFGTDQGLWVYDENTSDQIAVFNEDNSPLPSNQILDLAYNGKNGEVFIVTNRGMVSYRSASSNGNLVHTNVHVFPNPVRPNYNGLVAITGLARNVTLKVTDVNGNLVNELKSNGSSVSWNLLDQNGSQVGSGIYFFFSSTSDGEQTFVGKVAVIR